MSACESGARLIGRARAAAGLTQTALARRSGEPQSVISAYERGRRQPSVAAFQRLIEASGFELIIVRTPQVALDLRRSADELADALALSAALPTRPRPARLAFPPLPT